MHSIQSIVWSDSSQGMHEHIASQHLSACPLKSHVSLARLPSPFAQLRGSRTVFLNGICATDRLRSLHPASPAEHDHEIHNVRQAQRTHRLPGRLQAKALPTLLCLLDYLSKCNAPHARTAPGTAILYRTRQNKYSKQPFRAHARVVALGRRRPSPKHRHLCKSDPSTRAPAQVLPSCRQPCGRPLRTAPSASAAHQPC